MVEDERKLQVFDVLLDKYLNKISGYGYANMTWQLKNMFTKDEIVGILIKKFPDEDESIIIREINKEYGISQ